MAADGAVRLTPAARARALLWQRVADALDAAAYRVTLMQDGRGWNYTRPDRDAPERLLHRGELKDELGKLARHNASGWNVYITPLDPRHHYLVIDDIRGEAGLVAVRARGYQPALVQCSSPGNFQAVLKVPVNGETDLERRAANAWVRQVNLELGDPKFTGAVHPFRLAGLANRKSQYAQPDGRYPFVRLVSTDGGVCPVAAEEVQQLRQALSRPTAPGPADREQARSPESSSGALQRRPEALSSDVLQRYVDHRHQIEGWVHERGLPRDESRIDFEIARRLIREDVPLQQVALAIEVGSPDLQRRHPDGWAYASMTATNASQRQHETPRPGHKRPGGPDIDR